MQTERHNENNSLTHKTIFFSFFFHRLYRKKLLSLEKMFARATKTSAVLVYHPHVMLLFSHCVQKYSIFIFAIFHWACAHHDHHAVEDFFLYADFQNTTKNNIIFLCIYFLPCRASQLSVCSNNKINKNTAKIAIELRDFSVYFVF